MDRHDLVWNPWHGCHRCSEGCQNCYAFFLDKRYGRDTNEVVKNKSGFDLPVKKDRAGHDKLPAGSNVRVCMASDFFIEEADAWRADAWDIIRRRPDLMFSLLTKRAERIAENLPPDWGEGWENVTFAVSCENQRRLDERMPRLLDIPARHRWISLKPFIGEVHLDDYLADGKVEWVLAGGENYLGSRPLRAEWVKETYEACARHNVRFTFGQTGNVFIQDGVERKIHNRTEQAVAALRTGFAWPPVDIEREIQAIYDEKAAMKSALAEKHGQRKK